jgi:hypothetical protein
MDRITMEKQPDGAPLPGRVAQDHSRYIARRCSDDLREDWLETKLKGLYDEVANEPLPDALRQLIDKLDG